MYFKKIELVGTGPVERLSVDLLSADGRPKPIVFVGQNGSGKSILLSHLVNFLLVAKQEVYEDTEVEKGKVYKYRSPLYVKSGNPFSYASIESSVELSIVEWQLLQPKEALEKVLSNVPDGKNWEQIPPNETSYFQSNFSQHSPTVKDAVGKQCNLYFPVNRFEEPGWLNQENLTSRVKYRDQKNIQGNSNRNVISLSPLKENRRWLLDLILDHEVLEKRYRTEVIPSFAAGTPAKTVTVVETGHGVSQHFYNAALAVVKMILAVEGNIRLGIGSRQDRRITVMKDEKPWIPDLFQLSTGEVQLINLSLSILRDFDLSEAEFETLDNIKGIAIIDEIDAHLHVSHQKHLLPKLISLFPKVQFIMTSHSPLFLLGMKERFGDVGFSIFDMPTGDQIFASDFSELISAYEAIKATENFRRDIEAELIRHARPIVFVEGDYDIRYLTYAAKLLKKEELLSQFDLKDGGGFGNLDKIWRNYDNPTATLLSNEIILLYDCDTKKVNADNGKIHKRVIPLIEGNPCSIGIENLFPAATVARIEEEKPQFIDILPAVVTRVRGANVTKPELKSVNKDEKGNLCDWLCEKGTANDFRNFETVFSIIESILRTNAAKPLNTIV